MKMIFATTALLAVMVMPATAEASLTTTYALWGKYHGSDGSVFDPDPPSQFAITFAKDSFYTGIWISEDWDNNPDFGNEVDFFAGYAGEAGLLNYDVGGQYFVLHQPTADSGDVVNVYLQVSVPNVANVWGVSLSPYVKLDHYFPIDKEPADGTFYRFGVSADYILTQKWSMSVNQELAYDDGAFGADAGWLTFTDVGLNRSFDNGVTVSALMKMSSPLGSDNFRSFELTPGIEISKTWN